VTIHPSMLRRRFFHQCFEHFFMVGLFMGVQLAVDVPGAFLDGLAPGERLAGIHVPGFPDDVAFWRVVPEADYLDATI